MDLSFFRQTSPFHPSKNWVGLIRTFLLHFSKKNSWGTVGRITESEPQNLANITWALATIKWYDEILVWNTWTNF